MCTFMTWSMSKHFFKSRSSVVESLKVESKRAFQYVKGIFSLEKTILYLAPKKFNWIQRWSYTLQEESWEPLWPAWTLNSSSRACTSFCRMLAINRAIMGLFVPWSFGSDWYSIIKRESSRSLLVYRRKSATGFSILPQHQRLPYSGGYGWGLLSNTGW